MPSRYTQYGGAAGAEDVLKQMVMSRIAAEMEARKQAVENYKLGQTDRGMDLEGGRLAEDARQFDAAAPQRDAQTGYLRTQSAHLQSAPTREADERAHDAMMLEAKQADELAQIKAQGDQQARVAGIRTASSGQNRQRVEYQDAQGRPVVEYLTDDEVKGRKFSPPAPNSGAANRQKALDEVNLLEQQLNGILQYGRTNQWPGVGGLYQGTGKRVFKQQLGLGSDQGEMLRNLIGNLRTDIAHEKFGSAFTGNERAMLNTFAPDIDRDSGAIETNIQALLQQAQRKKLQLQGVTPAAAHDQPAGAASAGGASLEYDWVNGQLVPRK